MNSLSFTQTRMEHIGAAAIDIITTAVAATVTAATTVILSLVPDPTDELKLLLVPLIGALLASLPTILLYPERETRPIVFGRAGLALIISTLLPQTLAIIFSSTSTFFAHPVIGLLAGVLGYILIYFLIRPLFEGLYRRRKAIAEAVIEQGQQRLMGNMREAVNDAVDGKFHDAVNNPVAKQAANVVIATARAAAQDLKQTAEEVRAAAEKTQQLNKP